MFPDIIIVVYYGLSFLLLVAKYQQRVHIVSKILHLVT